MSLHEYYIITQNRDPSKKQIIPHFVGISGSPKYPVTEEYARHTIIVHKPWRNYPKDLDWISEFEFFINSKNCPPTAAIPYQRVMRRYIDKMTHYEPIASRADSSSIPISDADKQLLLMTGLKDIGDLDPNDALLQSLPRGRDYNWSKSPMVSNRVKICCHEYLFTQ